MSLVSLIILFITKIMPYQAIVNIVASKPYTAKELQSVLNITQGVYSSQFVSQKLVYTGYFVWTKKSWSTTFIVVTQSKPSIVSSNITAQFRRFRFQASVRITM